MIYFGRFVLSSQVANSNPCMPYTCKTLYPYSLYCIGIHIIHFERVLR